MKDRHSDDILPHSKEIDMLFDQHQKLQFAQSQKNRNTLNAAQDGKGKLSLIAPANQENMCRSKLTSMIIESHYQGKVSLQSKEESGDSH